MKEQSEKKWYSLKEKVVWVFGGAGYLGSAITVELDNLCKKALCIDIGEKAQQLVTEKHMKNTLPLAFDISQVDQLEEFIENTIQCHGIPDGVINLTTASSAGVRLEDLSIEEFRHTFEVSLLACFQLSRAIAERMKIRGSGSFVFFSSMYGMVAPDSRIYAPSLTPNPIDYGVCKGGILQMVRYFAMHYAAMGIRFNSVVPGAFPNPSVKAKNPDFIARLCEKIPVGRVGVDSEIIGPALFLLCDSASFVNGHNLVVDGGWTIW